MQIDIRTPHIPAGRKIWRMFPGEGYQFLSDFTEGELVFLDTPGFPLPDGLLSDAPDFVNRLALSDAVRDYIKDNGTDEVPEFDLNDYQAVRNSTRRTRNQNALTNLLQHAKKNDLIVLPEPKWMSRVHVGRFTDNAIYSGYAPQIYGDVILPARSVKWLGSYTERAISEKLSMSLRQTYPFTLLENSVYLEVFALAYDSYIYKDRNAATIFNGEEFLDADASLLSNISKIAAAVCMAVDQDGLDVDLEAIGGARLLHLLLRNPPI